MSSRLGSCQKLWTHCVVENITLIRQDHVVCCAIMFSMRRSSREASARWLRGHDNLVLMKFCRRYWLLPAGRVLPTLSTPTLKVSNQFCNVWQSVIVLTAEVSICGLSHPRVCLSVCLSRSLSMKSCGNFKIEHRPELTWGQHVKVKRSRDNALTVWN